MRHGKKNNHLGRTAAHRSAMLSNMAASLILHKRVITTVAKAKAVRKYTEPLLTKGKNDTTHSRRTVFSYLQSKEAVKELFDNIAGKIANRPGGYTRILKTGNRLGDNADMCIIELVDYNEDMLSSTGTAAAGKAKTRRRSSGKKKEGAEATAAPETSAPAASSEEAKAADAPETPAAE
jgi:large subunit ribosomal protein L17